MPLGVVSDEDFQKELENSESRIQGNSVSIGLPSNNIDSSNNESVEGEIVDLARPGRKAGDNNVPESLRKLIAETAHLQGRQAAIDLANEFGVSPTSVSAYTAGKTSTASESKDTGISAFLSSRKNKISKRASRILMNSLGHITDEKLKDAPAGVLAGVAKSLSGVIRDLEPEAEREKQETAKFIVYAPQVYNENHFDSMELKE